MCWAPRRTGARRCLCPLPSFSDGTHAQHTHAAPPHVKDEHAKDAAQGVAQDVAKDVPQDVARDLAFGARAARTLLATPLPPPPSLRNS